MMRLVWVLGGGALCLTGSEIAHGGCYSDYCNNQKRAYQAGQSVLNRGGTYSEAGKARADHIFKSYPGVYGDGRAVPPGTGFGAPTTPPRSMTWQERARMEQDMRNADALRQGASRFIQELYQPRQPTPAERAQMERQFEETDALIQDAERFLQQLGQ